MKFLKIKLKKDDQLTKKFLKLKGEKSYIQTLKTLIKKVGLLDLSKKELKESDYIHISSPVKKELFNEIERLAKKHNTTKTGLIKMILEAI